MYLNDEGEASGSPRTWGCLKTAFSCRDHVWMEHKEGQGCVARDDVESRGGMNLFTALPSGHMYVVHEKSFSTAFWNTLSGKKRHSM